MPRRNHRGGAPQAPRRTEGKPRRPRARTVPLEQMVIPRGRCFFRSRYGKLIFSEAEVEKALKQAQRMRAARASGYVESRYYECPEGGCGGFHLTSRETYNERGQA